jgi:hypothetical protein
MSKPALHPTTSKAAFTWDPNKPQTYSLDQDLPLPGTAESFNKTVGNGFTMDAPFYTLTLQVSSGSYTTWGAGDDMTPTLIKVERGTFAYSGPDTGITFLNFADIGSSTSQTALTVENDAKFIVTGPNGVVFGQSGALNITITDQGLVDVTCLELNFPQQEGVAVDVRIEQAARMSIVSTGYFQIENGTIRISSAPETGNSLYWASTSPQASGSMELDSTVVDFSEGSSGFFRSLAFTLADTRIRVGDTAKCDLRFDSAKVQDGSQFILGPGKARMQFEGYTSGKRPFDFINDEPKRRYPQGMFEFTSEGTVNGGSFVIQVGSGFEANAIVSNGFVAIDGDVQTKLGRVDATFDPSTQYATIKQIAP